MTRDYSKDCSTLGNIFAIFMRCTVLSVKEPVAAVEKYGALWLAACEIAKFIAD